MLLLLPHCVVPGLGGAHMIIVPVVWWVDSTVVWPVEVALAIAGCVRATAEPLVADVAKVKGEDGGKCAWSVLCLSEVASLPAPSQRGTVLSRMFVGTEC
jgi:hypothetical protein